MAVETKTQTIPTLDAFITTLVPSGYLRWIIDRPSGDAEEWFRLLADGWCELREERTQPGFKTVLGRHGADRIFFSPCEWRHPWTRELPFVTPLHSLWCSIPLANEPVRTEHASVRLTSTSDFIRVNPESERQARTRLDNGLLPPSIVLNEGLRLSAFWLLASPLDAIDARRWLHRIATHFGVARDAQAEPEMARFSVPDTRLINVIPATTVNVATFSPELRYTIGDIERWLEGA